MDFSYVNIKTKGCEGWLNLFFGEHVIAMVANVWLADRIREKIDGAKEPAVQADAWCGAANCPNNKGKGKEIADSQPKQTKTDFCAVCNDFELRHMKICPNCGRPRAGRKP